MIPISLEIRRAAAPADYFEIVAEGGIILRANERREVLERHLVDLAAMIHGESTVTGNAAMTAIQINGATLGTRQDTAPHNPGIETHSGGDPDANAAAAALAVLFALLGDAQLCHRFHHRFRERFFPGWRGSDTFEARASEVLHWIAEQLHASELNE